LLLGVLRPGSPQLSLLAEAKVYLVPPRSIVRGVADAAALVVVDHRQRTVEIVEVISDYFETSEQDWLDILARADRALENHGHPI